MGLHVVARARSVAIGRVRADRGMGRKPTLGRGLLAPGASPSYGLCLSRPDAGTPSAASWGTDGAA